MLKNYKILLFFVALWTGAALFGCGTQTGSFYAGSLGLNKPRLIVANNSQIVAYDLTGKLLGVLYDYTYLGGIPKGLAQFDALRMVVSVNTLVRLDLVGIDSSFLSSWGSSSNFTTAAGPAVKDSSGNYYTIRSTSIVKWDPSGNRTPTGVNDYIVTTIGACTLSGPAGLAFDSLGRLVATNTTNNTITVYTITSSSAGACAASVAAAGLGPKGIAQATIASNLVFFGGATTNQIYSLTTSGTITSIYNTPAVISNPTAMLEMPDGTLLVASGTTGSIERITTAGTRVGTTSFIKDGFTGTVNAMIIMNGL